MKQPLLIGLITFMQTKLRGIPMPSTSGITMNQACTSNSPTHATGITEDFNR